MIKKFTKIKNAGVFNDFDWPKNEKGTYNHPFEFKDVNIIYGQNYSGKTTLSRIPRSFEKGKLPEGFESIEFEILTSSGKTYTQLDIKTLLSDDIAYKVFNEDFIRDNLVFFGVDTPHSAPFTILGEKNVSLEAEIKSCEEKIGSNVSGEETGLRKQLVQTIQAINDKRQQINCENDLLEKSLKEKAKDIKYNHEKVFGDINYHFGKLKADIAKKYTSTYTPLSETEKQKLFKTIQETSKPQINRVKVSQETISIEVAHCSELCSKKIGSSRQIQELATNIMLAEWVQRGLSLHQDRSVCGFCGQPIPDSRRKELNDHFNRETEELSDAIEQEIQNLSNLQESLFASIPHFSSSSFYNSFSNDAEERLTAYKNETEQLCSGISYLIDCLEKRKKTITSPFDIDMSRKELTINIKHPLHDLNSIIEANNNYTIRLSEVIDEAKNKLKINEIASYVIDSNYFDRQSKIASLELEKKDLESKNEKLLSEISDLESQIKVKRAQLENNTAGVNIINSYLVQAMPTSKLRLQAIETDSSGVLFEITRNGLPAFNLSEGERSLIAFSYFVSTLSDVALVNKRIILWIDDPISSLDQNNIFGIYGILEQVAKELKKEKRFEQLFISTHNLVFLHYIIKMKIKDKEREYFYISRAKDQSSITVMPAYIRRQGTEFNYWFENIVQCAKSEINEENIHWYESFGNNVRKFFDFELYFKYPTFKGDDFGLSQFWGDETAIPQILSSKLSDEYSHSLIDIDAEGIFAQAEEIHSTAITILKQLKIVDRQQYDALIDSTPAKLDPIPE